MEQKTLEALKWIVGILGDHHVPYRIGGGLATHVYGFDRPVNDIDISLSGNCFQELVRLVKEFIVAGPKQYLNEKWDCTTLSLSYHGQDIDLTDVDTLLMWDKDDTRWIRNREIYGKWPNVTREVEGVNATLMHPRFCSNTRSTSQASIRNPIGGSWKNTSKPSDRNSYAPSSSIKGIGRPLWNPNENKKGLLLRKSFDSPMALCRAGFD